MKIKLNKYNIIELACVAALIVFVICLIISLSAGTDKSIEQISQTSVKYATELKMKKKSANTAAKTFGFDAKKAEGVVYYCNDSIMDVSELLIVKLKNSSDAKDFEQAIQNRVNNQENLFKNYAPEQYALLQNSIIECDANTVFYCTAENNKEIYNSFKKGL